MARRPEVNSGKPAEDGSVTPGGICGGLGGFAVIVSVFSVQLLNSHYKNLYFPFTKSSKRPRLKKAFPNTLGFYGSNSETLPLHYFGMLLLVGNPQLFGF
jgi:hypothetical protein